MIEFLYSVDRWLFCFLNQTISNRFFDLIMPPITDWNLSWVGRSLAIGLWLFLFFRGGKRGKTAALLLIVLILITDQLSSQLLKQIFARLRPCHLVGGVPVVETVHLMAGVGCGGGYSFPSGHAVNNIAFAALISHYYPGWKWAAFGYGIVMALSRVLVGVHYPSDVIIGGLIGYLCAVLLLRVWSRVMKKFPILDYSR